MSLRGHPIGPPKTARAAASLVSDRSGLHGTAPPPALSHLREEKLQKTLAHIAQSYNAYGQDIIMVKLGIKKYNKITIKSKAMA